MTSRISDGFDSTRTSPWRRAAMCVVDGGAPAPARLERIDGHGATIRTNAALTPGAKARLSHTIVGTIEATVSDTDSGLTQLVFTPGTSSVGFAMAAIAADLLRVA